MLQPSPGHRLTPSGKGWFKRVKGVHMWICSFKAAPTGEEADRIFEEKFAALAASVTTRAVQRVERQSTVADFVAVFVDRKRSAAKQGKLDIRTANDYEMALVALCDVCGHKRPAMLTPDDFSAFAQAIGEQGFYVQMRWKINVRSFFNWLVEMDWIDRAPKYGPDMALPDRKERRKARAESRKRAGGKLVYSPDEVRALLLAAKNPVHRAMILLGLNCGFGNTDIATLPRCIVGGDWLEYERPKTGAERKCPLWPETKAALDAVMAMELHDKRVFATRFGKPYIDTIDKGTGVKDQIIARFKAICTAAGVKYRGFYSLRRTFRTIADELGDERAAKLIMGHAEDRGDMGAVYVQEIIGERLQRVVNHVRTRLGIAEAVQAAHLEASQTAKERQAHREKIRLARNARQNERRRRLGRADRPQSIVKARSAKKRIARQIVAE